MSNSTIIAVISLIKPLNKPVPSVKPLNKFKTRFKTAETRPSNKPGAANTLDLNKEINTLIYKNKTDAKSVKVAYNSGNVQPKYGSNAGVKF